MIGALVKGMLVPDDSVPLPFLYNPNEVTESRTVNYAETEAPGPSHAGVQYVAGKGRDLSFTLECHSPFVYAGARVPIVLEAYVESIHQLTLPTYVGGELTKGPPTVLLILGGLIRSVKVKSMSIVSKQWTQAMLLKHVQIQLGLVEVVDASQSRGWAR